MSTLRVNTLQDVPGTGQPAMAGAAKAWVNFNGTGVVAIRASFNVGSITDNGVGDYTVNFTTALADANYSVSGMNTDTTGANMPALVLALVATPLTTTSCRVNSRNASSGTLTDFQINCVAVHR